jgi:hypothetical protein
MESQDQSILFRRPGNRDQGRAQQQAEQYPRRWSEFDTWLDRQAADFTAAEYDSMEGIAGIPLPTAANSVFAAILICSGVLAGAGVAIWLVWTMEQRDFGAYLVSAAIVGTGGAWLGYYVHDSIRSGLVPVTTPHSRSHSRQRTRCGA